jgi:antitoxin VapB
MSLSVKDPEAYRLARAIADKTGETLAKVVIDSLRERQEKVEKKRTKATVDEMMAIARRAAASATCPHIDHADLLYDEWGLPK